MKKILSRFWVLTTMLIVTLNAMAGDGSVATNATAIEGLSARKFTITEQAGYLLYLPKAYDANSTNRWPVILFLHGIGESGTNVWTTAKHGPVKFIASHPDFPFILISPQCPFGHKWSPDVILGILDEVENQFAVDKSRVYLTGLSMGGYGVWDLATTYPERFAAVAPVSGGGDTLGLVVCLWRGKTPFLKSLPFWVFHGAKDTVVPISESQRMVEALKKTGCTDVKMTVYPDAGHDAWTETYNKPALYEWFLQHDRR